MKKKAAQNKPPRHAESAQHPLNERLQLVSSLLLTEIIRVPGHRRLFKPLEFPFSFHSWILIEKDTDRNITARRRSSEFPTARIELARSLLTSLARTCELACVNLNPEDYVHSVSSIPLGNETLGFKFSCKPLPAQSLVQVDE